MMNDLNHFTLKIYTVYNLLSFYQITKKKTNEMILNALFFPYKYLVIWLMAKLRFLSSKVNYFLTTVAVIMAFGKLFFC